MVSPMVQVWVSRRKEPWLSGVFRVECQLDWLLNLAHWWNFFGCVRWLVVALASMYGFWPLPVCLCSPALLPGHHELSSLLYHVETFSPMVMFLSWSQLTVDRLFPPLACVRYCVLTMRKLMHPSSLFTGKNPQIGNHTI